MQNDIHQQEEHSLIPWNDPEKCSDLIEAGKESLAEFLSADVFPNIGKSLGNVMLNDVAGALVGTVLSAACPALNTAVMSYRQARTERNLRRAIDTIVQRQNALEEMVQDHIENHPQYVLCTTEAFLDNIANEIKPETVDYSTRGYINILRTDNTNEDIAIMFFRTLHELNDLDIEVLKYYRSLSLGQNESILRLCDVHGISGEQIGLVRDKLHRLGLLLSRNEEILEDDLNSIVKYFEKVKGENKKSHPKEVDIPRLKKTSSSDTYRITNMGRQYLEFIEA